MRLLDLTTLSPDGRPAEIEALCARAARPVPSEPSLRVAAVCVLPLFVSTAVASLAGTGVPVASVAGNFPSGLATASAKADEAREAVAHGAREIDMVIDRVAMLAGDAGAVRREVAAVRAAVPGALLKVILEACDLPPSLFAEAAAIAVDEGADFLKTSTGFGSRGASAGDVALLANVAARAGRPVGVKAAGGVRSIADASLYLRIAEGVLGPLDSTGFRIGASALLDRLTEALLA